MIELQHYDDYLSTSADLAGDPGCPAKMIVEFYHADSSPIMRQALARRSFLPLEIALLLAEDENTETLEVLSSNSSMPEVVMQKLACNPAPSIRARVGRNATQLPVLMTLLADENEAVRKAVGDNFATPLPVLMLLLADENGSVRTAAATHMNMPHSTLVQIAKDGTDLYLCKELAQDEFVHKEVLIALAEHEDDKVRSLVARHPSLPIEQLASLAFDERHDVQLGVALHPDCPACVIEKLCCDSGDVRLAVARHPNTPSDILHQLAHAEEDLVTIAVAAHPNTPHSAIAHLLKKGVPTRKGVALNLNTPVIVLFNLFLLDRSSTVNRAAIRTIKALPPDAWEKAFIAGLTLSSNIGRGKNAAPLGDLLLSRGQVELYQSIQETELRHRINIIAPIPVAITIGLNKKTPARL